MLLYFINPGVEDLNIYCSKNVVKKCCRSFLFKMTFEALLQTIRNRKHYVGVIKPYFHFLFLNVLIYFKISVFKYKQCITHEIVFYFLIKR